MHINKMITSAYLRAADIETDSLTLTIDDLRQEEVGQQKDLKYVLYFSEVTKGLVLNATNINTIGKLHGNETDDWIGKPITLFVTTVNMNGESKEAIRVSPRPARGQQQQPAQAQPPIGRTYNQQQQAQPTQNTGRGAATREDIPF